MEILTLIHDKLPVNTRVLALEGMCPKISWTESDFLINSNTLHGFQ